MEAIRLTLGVQATRRVLSVSPRRFALGITVRSGVMNTADVMDGDFLTDGEGNYLTDGNGDFLTW